MEKRKVGKDGMGKERKREGGRVSFKERGTKERCSTHKKGDRFARRLSVGQGLFDNDSAHPAFSERNTQFEGVSQFFLRGLRRCDVANCDFRSKTLEGSSSHRVFSTGNPSLFEARLEIEVSQKPEVSDAFVIRFGRHLRRD